MVEVMTFTVQDYRRAAIFHLDYSEKACKDHATFEIFNNSLKAGSHDPILDPIFTQVQRSY